MDDIKKIESLDEIISKKMDTNIMYHYKNCYVKRITEQALKGRYYIFDSSTSKLTLWWSKVRMLDILRQLTKEGD